jgi:protoheme IX farnesyltransferase
MSPVLDLFKLRIGVVIAVTALAGAMVVPGESPGAGAVAVLVLSVFASSAAAGAFNQYHEVDLDRLMRRTRRRPFVTGALRHHAGWLALIVAMVALSSVTAWLATNALAALFTFLGAFFYAIVYTVWLKRRTWWNIVIGGAAGSFAVLAGAAAVAPGLPMEAWLLAAVLFLWTPPHFWSLAIACRDDYREAGVPMLPLIKGDACAARAIAGHAVLLVAASFVLGLLSPGPLYLAFAAAGGVVLLRPSLALLRTCDRANAVRVFRGSLVQLSLLLLGVMLDAGLRATLAG